MTIFRRIRGLIGCALLGAIPGTLLGVATIFVLRLGLIPGTPFYIASPISENLYVVGAVIGATLGALIGVVFGVLVLASERNRSIDDVRMRRFVVLGAIASASVFSVIYGNAWGDVGAGAFCAVALGIGVFGAATSASILWVARRATRPALSTGADEPQLPRGAT